MGEAGEGQNITHQQKKMTDEALYAFRDRFGLELTDEQIAKKSFYRPADDSPEITYLRERREALGGGLPVRGASRAEPLPVPELDAFKAQLDGTGEREISTTMAFVRILATLVRDKQIGPHIVPIVPDESRTFGMEGMFRQLGIFCQVGQLYQPEDSEQLMFYREDKKGQILQEGINEAGAFSSWIAAGDVVRQPRRPDGARSTSTTRCSASSGSATSPGRPATTARAGSCSAAPPGARRSTARACSTRTATATCWRRLIPNCVSYDPTYAYEVAVIVQDGLRRMVGEQEDVFYYLTLMNENYPHPAMPEGAEEGILQGDPPAPRGDGADVQLLGSGTILREVEAAADLLREDFGVEADVWSVTSFTELRRDGMEAERWNLLHPGEDAARPVRRPRCSPDAPGRWRRPTTCARSPSRSARTCPAATRRSAPTATAAATGAGRCASSSRSTATTSRSPRCARSAPDKAGGQGDRELRDRDRRGGPVAEVKEVTRPRHRGLRRRAGDRGAGRAGRRRRGGGPAGHARVRQGDDGRAGAVRAASVQDLKVVGRRQGVRGHAAARRSRSAATAAPRRRPSATRRRGARRRRRGRDGDRGRGGGGRRAARPRRRPPSRRATATSRRTRARPCAGWRASRGSTSRRSQGTGRKGRITKEDVDAAGRGARRRAGARARRDVGRRSARRARAAVAHQEDLRPAPAAELADDPARHPARRGRHHRPRGVPQADQRRSRTSR